MASGGKETLRKAERSGGGRIGKGDWENKLPPGDAYSIHFIL